MIRRLLLLLTILALIALPVQAGSINASGDFNGPLALHIAEAGATANGTAITVQGYATVAVFNTADASWDGTLNFEVTIDGINFTVVECRNFATGTALTTVVASSATVSCPINGITRFRARITGRTTGTTTVTANLAKAGPSNASSGSAGVGKFVDGTDPLDAVYLLGNVGINTILPSTTFDVNGAITQETFVIRKRVTLLGATNNTTTNFFTVTTTDEAGSADGGSYTVKMNLDIDEAGAASGAVNTAGKSLLAHFKRTMASAGTGTNSTMAEISETASANEGTGAITTVTLTIVETTEFVQTIQLLVDTSGGVFNGTALVELVYSHFTTAPVIAGI